jgi:hypothetical protein
MRNWVTLPVNRRIFTVRSSRFGTVALTEITMKKSTCLLFALLAASLAQQSMAQDCDRSCLEGFADTYLDAVSANDPNAVKLAADVRYTEDGQQLAIGDGLWNTLKGKGQYRIIVSDVPAQQVVYMGVIREDHRDPAQETLALLALRLRIRGGEITEIEQNVVRDPNAAARVEARTPRPVFSSPIPVGERMSRQQLLETANMYFSGMQKNDGLGNYPFADNCDRLENGSQTTNAPTPEGQVRPDPSDATNYSAQWSCREQFESGLLFFVNRIRDRRYVAVDEERGLVVAFGFFDHSGGETRRGVTPNGREVIAGPVQPWTWYITELFRVENGLLGEIEAFLQRVPYGMLSGWSTWEQGMSSELQDVTFSDD